MMNQKPQKSRFTVIGGFFFQALFYYLISKINQPSRTTIIIVILIGSLFIWKGVQHFPSEDIYALGMGIALIAWVLYRNRYPKPPTPSPLQDIQIAFSEIKKKMLADQKEAEEQDIPLKEYLTKKYEDNAGTKVEVGSLGSLLAGLLIATVFVLVGAYMLKEEWRLNNQFLETTCKIQDKSLGSSERKDKTYYSTKFYVSYRAGSQTITQWIDSSLLETSTSSQYAAQETLDKFKKDQSYPCWYDSKNIRKVALERGYSWFAILFFGTSLGIFILLAWTVVKDKLSKKL
jgi:hypothetical protein